MAENLHILPLSWIQSFYDAPDGFKEEMQEIMISVGLEYWYRQSVCHTCRLFP